MSVDERLNGLNAVLKEGKKIVYFTLSYRFKSMENLLLSRLQHYQFFPLPLASTTPQAVSKPLTLNPQFR
jgi:hypothetical protein